MKCLFCEREFEGERSTAKFCSGTCRKAHSRLEVSVTSDGLSVTENEVSVTEGVRLDLEKDLKLNMEKDLGIYSWSKDGVFIRPDITIEQVRRIRRLVEAKNGWEERKYA